LYKSALRRADRFQTSKSSNRATSLPDKNFFRP
jgi:hypothetical protein